MLWRSGRPAEGGRPHRRPTAPLPTRQWSGLRNRVWSRRDKEKVTILFNFVERRKSLFLRAYFERQGFRFVDLGAHRMADVSYGKEYGNRMECNPMYFTSGALLRALLRLEREEGLSKAEVVERYVFLGGGGQCGPCRYGMYPQEYLKVVNEAGFEGFRVLIFGSDLSSDEQHPDSAFRVDLTFRLDMLVAIVLADMLHIAECALRPFAVRPEEVDLALERAEKMLCEALRKPQPLARLLVALRRAGRLFAAIERRHKELPLIFVTGEFFANLSHGEANYNLRRFIMDEGCEVLPGIFTQRILYDNWRRSVEARRGMTYAKSRLEQVKWGRSWTRQTFSSAVIRAYWRAAVQAFAPETFGGRAKLLDLEELARLAQGYYNPEIFGGEGHLEVAEALHLAGVVDGFISCKPFGCMASSGVSDGVMAKITALHPELDFLSIETSGDNEVSILSRVSMLLFKAKQRVSQRADR